MKSFEDQYAEHAVHNVVEQLATSLDDVQVGDTDADLVNYIARIGQGAAFIRDRLKVASPVLTTAAKLNQLQQSIQACLNEVNSYKANKNIAHLANASNQLDAALAFAVSLISLEQPNSEVSAEDAISFKRLADAAINALSTKANAAEAEVTKLSQSCSKLTDEITNQNNRVTAINQEVEAKVGTIQNAFTESQAEKKKAFDVLLQEVGDAHAAKLEELSSSSGVAIDSMNTQLREAKHIVHLIGNIGVTGNFRGAATHEARMANIFRVIALLCFLGMVTVILYMGFVSLHEKFDLWLAVFRFAIGFAFLVPGVYAARESSRHRTLEHRNRRAELELASIDSYLNSLPKEKQDEIKAELSPRYFGGSDEQEEDKDGVSSKSIVELLAAAIKGLSSR